MTINIFIHVGLHKTGTTAIQVALTGERKNLIRSGILYPETGCPAFARFGQHCLAWALMRRPEYIPRAARECFDEKKIWIRLKEEIESSNCESVIISSEEFDCLSLEEIEIFKSKLEKFSIVPILFIRSLPEFTESCYRTSIMHGDYVKSIDEFLGTMRSRIDLASLCADWSKICEHNKLKLIDYDDISIREDVLTTFLGVIEISTKLFSSNYWRRINESYPASICEIVRFMREQKISEDRISEWLSNTQEVRNNRWLDRLIPDSAILDLESRYREEVAALLAFQSKYDIVGRFDAMSRLVDLKFVSSAAEAILTLGRLVNDEKTK